MYINIITNNNNEPSPVLIHITALLLIVRFLLLLCANVLGFVRVDTNQDIVGVWVYR